MKETETVEFKKSFAELKAGLVSNAAMLNKLWGERIVL
jgi:hypothetical protein